MTDAKIEIYRKRFQVRGEDMGGLLGRLAVMQSGDQVTFNGMVFVKDESELVSIYEGNMLLRLCDSRDLNYKKL